ncbi:putative odorant receptor 85d [Rhagoletis pomonella]|uniref:putative odorant receptor 85d n=1 Tax=Rhagoletis pomonella TaxID=28610 RepID=UPI0017809017|nr:putative odorant receptor 85d [Rhagoletis pomonella]
MPSNTITFSAFIRKANFWYNSNGIEPYDDVYNAAAEKSTKQESIAANITRALRHYLSQLFSLIILINMNFVLLTEAAFVVVNFLENADFMQAAKNLTFVGFVFVAVFKTWHDKRQRVRISLLMRQLYDIYPKQALDQPQYELQQHLDHYQRITFAYVFTIGFTAWCYNFLPLLNYLIFEQWLQRGTWQPTLPYYVWVPFEWRNNWLYYPLYVSQALATHNCLASYVATDLLLCAAAVQLIMHFRQLSRNIEQYEPSVESEWSSVSKDLKFLCAIVSQHYHTLDLCQLINEIFGLPMLINFISISFVICFLAFQFTVGVPLGAMIMLISYISCSLIQIYMICGYGQELITTSENVGHAVYNHNWLAADIRYKKMLTIIIQRAQKSATLRATSFVNVSMGTLTDLLQLSYKFFALIRTMYAR